MPIVILLLLNIGSQYRDSIAVLLRRVIYHERMSKPVPNVDLFVHITCNQSSRVNPLCSLAYFNPATLEKNSFLFATKQK